MDLHRILNPPARPVMPDPPKVQRHIPVARPSWNGTGGPNFNHNTVRNASNVTRSTTGFATPAPSPRLGDLSEIASAALAVQKPVNVEKPKVVVPLSPGIQTPSSTTSTVRNPLEWYDRYTLDDGESRSSASFSSSSSPGFSSFASAPAKQHASVQTPPPKAKQVQARQEVHLPEKQVPEKPQSAPEKKLQKTVVSPEKQPSQQHGPKKEGPAPCLPPKAVTLEKSKEVTQDVIYVATSPKTKNGSQPPYSEELYYNELDDDDDDDYEPRTIIPGSRPWACIDLVTPPPSTASDEAASNRGSPPAPISAPAAPTASPAATAVVEAAPPKKVEEPRPQRRQSGKKTTWEDDEYNISEAEEEDDDDDDADFDEEVVVDQESSDSDDSEEDIPWLRAKPTRILRGRRTNQNTKAIVTYGKRKCDSVPSSASTSSKNTPTDTDESPQRRSSPRKTKGQLRLVGRDRTSAVSTAKVDDKSAPYLSPPLSASQPRRSDSPQLRAPVAPMAPMMDPLVDPLAPSLTTRGKKRVREEEENSASEERRKKKEGDESTGEKDEDSSSTQRSKLLRLARSGSGERKDSKTDSDWDPPFPKTTRRPTRRLATRNTRADWAPMFPLLSLKTASSATESSSPPTTPVSETAKTTPPATTASMPPTPPTPLPNSSASRCAPELPRLKSSAPIPNLRLDSPLPFTPINPTSIAPAATAPATEVPQKLSAQYGGKFGGRAGSGINSSSSSSSSSNTGTATMQHKINTDPILLASAPSGIYKLRKADTPVRSSRYVTRKGSGSPAVAVITLKAFWEPTRVTYADLRSAPAQALAFRLMESTFGRPEAERQVRLAAAAAARGPRVGRYANGRNLGLVKPFPLTALTNPKRGMGKSEFVTFLAHWRETDIDLGGLAGCDARKRAEEQIWFHFGKQALREQVELFPNST